MLGLHQALIPIHTTLIEQQGYTVLLPILAMAGAGQVGAALAVYFRLPHNRSIRTTIKSALPAGFLGVGEPLIYGVSLPLGRPFITACIGGAFGGGFVGLCNQLGDAVGSTAIGPSGWALFPLVKGSQSITTTLVVYALGLAVGYLTGFLATYFFGFSKPMLAELNMPADADAPCTPGTSPRIPTRRPPHPAPAAPMTPPTPTTPTTPTARQSQQSRHPALPVQLSDASRSTAHGRAASSTCGGQFHCTPPHATARRPELHARPRMADAQTDAAVPLVHRIASGHRNHGHRSSSPCPGAAVRT